MGAMNAVTDRGIVYVATNHDRYVEEAFLSAHSVKERYPNLSVTLFTDLTENPLCRSDRFDIVRRIAPVTGYASDWAAGLLARVQCLRQSPYERTLHIDTDTRIQCDDLQNLFDVLDSCDAGLVEASPEDSFSRKHFGRRMFNGGVILFQRNAGTTTWLREWEELSRRYFRAAGETPLPDLKVVAHVADEGIRRELLNNDQIGLSEILNPESNRYGLAVANLGYEWNHRGFVVAGRSRVMPKILHSPALKKTTVPDILEVAFQFARCGRQDDAEALYGYIAAKHLPRPTPWWKRWLRPGKAREEWANSLLRRADLHHRYMQLPQAKALALQVVDGNPDDAYALAALARIAMRGGQKEEAIALAAHARGLHDSSPYIAEAYGEVLLAAGRFLEAAEALRVAAKRGRATGAYLLGQAYFQADLYAEAAGAYHQALRLQPDHWAAESNLLPALLGSRAYAEAAAHADRILVRDEWHVRALAFKCVALAELGRRTDLEALADFQHLIAREVLGVPPGYDSRETFHRRLGAALARLPDLARDPMGHATRLGLHSEANLADSAEPAIQALNTLILDAVRKRMQSITGNHPFAKHVPRAYKLHAWTVIMNEGGHQIPHMHASAWLSGVYYVEVPSSVTRNDPANRGWLEFGPAEGRWHRAETSVPMRRICPEPGLLVTFPAFFWHGTLPLQGRSRRISYAFDIVPL